MLDEVLQLKQQMRKEAAARRAKQADPDLHSRRIFERLATLPEYAGADAIMLYLNVRCEVRTQWFVPAAWEAGKKVAIPFCENGEIELFRLEGFEELLPGTMGVLEPTAELRRRADRKVDPKMLDLIVAPGLAFDRRGGRLGYGKGYYDKLLHQIRHDATKMAVCFECQLFPEIPLLDHDIRMDAVVTEKAVYRTQRL